MREMFSLFPEFNDNALVEDPSEAMQTWRERALVIIVLASLIANIPAALASIGGNFAVIPEWAANTVFVLYLLCVGFALCQRFPLIWRIYVHLGGKALIGGIQLITTQLAGSGRLYLAFLPVTGLILGGSRVAGNLLLLSIFIISSTTGMIISGIIKPLTVNADTISAGYWVFQLMVWLGALAPQLYLMWHFLALQDRIVAAVSAAHKKINDESERNRRLEYEINKTGEEERQKLGAELHDGLCQHLTATLLSCSTLEYEKKAVGAADLGSIEKIREAVERSIGMAYEVARGLCPVPIETGSLLPALQMLCREMRQRSEVGCKVWAETGVVIPTSEAGLHLYRIAGEAMTNALKHSGCSGIVIKLSGNEYETVLEIADNGRGMPVEREKEATKGMGLNVMRYRATLIGATLGIKANEAGGTSVVCCLPLTEKRL